MKGKKTGGRQKGTCNKVTTMSKQVINSLLSDYSSSGRMAADFDALEGRDRLIIAEKLMGYVMPKMQSTSVDVAMSGEKKSLEETLEQLARTGEKA